MVSQTGPRVVRSNTCKGPNLTWKRAKKEPKGQTKILGPASVVCPKRTNLVTLAPMLRRPEPTRKRVEPTTIGITAIEIQLDQVHFAIAVNFNVVCGVITTGVRIFSILMLMRMNPHLGMN